MKLSAITEKTTKLPVTVSGETFNAEIYTNRWTGEYLDSWKDDAAGGKFTATVLSRTIASWDLEFDPETDKDDKGNPLEGIIPLDETTLYKRIPTTVLQEIFKGINKAMTPDPLPSTPSGSF